jgi:hypothetical protein
MKTIILPASIEDAKPRLISLDSLAAATEWERAAIVFVFTELVGQGGQKTNPSLLTADEFAALRFAGLKSKDTVRRYHEAWATHGDPDIKAGDKIELPDVTYPSGPTSNRGSRLTPSNAVKEVRALPDETKEEVVLELIQDPDLALLALDQVVADRQKERATPEETTIQDTIGLLRIRTKLADARRAAEKVADRIVGQPDTDTEEALLRYSRMAYGLGDYLRALAEMGSLDEALARMTNEIE